MSAELNIDEQIVTAADTSERREGARIYKPFLVRVRGAAKSGEPFVIDTVTDNISGEGFYLRLPLEIEPQSTIRAVVRFSTVSTEETAAARLWLKGEVVRAEPWFDGRFGIAVVVRRFRFLSAKLKSASHRQ